MFQTEAVHIVRVIIGDLDLCNPTYTDDRLGELVLVSAQLVQKDVALSAAYIVDVDSGTISPDPTDHGGGTRDDIFVNLIVLKAACILDMINAKTSAGQAISIRDGSSAVSLGGTATARAALLKIGYCQAYKDAVKEYKFGTIGSNIGVAILGPLRTEAGVYFSQSVGCRDVWNGNY